MLNYGQHPHMGHEPRLLMKLNSVEIFIEKMKKLRTEAEEALNKAATDMKKFYDKNEKNTNLFYWG